MRIRTSAPWGALIVVLVAVFAYSVGAQQIGVAPVRDLVTVKAVPDGKDIRSLYGERAPGHADPSGTAPTRFRPKDRRLAFLESL